MISSFARTPFCRHAAAWFALLSLWTGSTSAQDAPLVFLIQPTLSEEATRRAFQPLADYLGQATGLRITLVTPPNFLAHWQTVRRNTGYDLVLDDAHFTDYRVQKFRFYVLAKMPGTMSYSLVTARTKRVFDPLELTGKTVASFGPPSIGATRLSAMFPNPARRPAIVEIANANDGLELVLQGKVNAAMLPTSIVSEHVGANRLFVVTSSEPTPQMALSVSPRVSATLREKIREALLRAGRPGDGERILRNAGFERFETATPATYANQARILKDYWGY